MAFSVNAITLLIGGEALQLHLFELKADNVTIRLSSVWSVSPQRSITNHSGPGMALSVITQPYRQNYSSLNGGYRPGSGRLSDRILTDGNRPNDLGG